MLEIDRLSVYYPRVVKPLAEGRSDFRSQWAKVDGSITNPLFVPLMLATIPEGTPKAISTVVCQQSSTKLRHTKNQGYRAMSDVAW